MATKAKAKIAGKKRKPKSIGKTKTKGIGSTKCSVPKTKKFGEKVFSKVDKTYTKTDAKKAAEKHRAGGKTKLARVVTNPCGKGFLVYKRG